MSNIIQIKTGSTKPDDGILSQSELGFDKVNKNLYIGNNGKTEQLTVKAEDTGDGNIVLNPFMQQTGDSAKLPSGGGKMSGDINMNGNNRITNLAKPTNMKDAVSKESLLDLIYPIGSIYMSMNNNSPQYFLGGTWERIEGRFLLSADSKHIVGTVGGEEEVTLTIDQMPKHNHGIQLRGVGLKKQASVQWKIEEATNYFDPPDVIREAGGNQPHNNMPPYLVVYMWKRTE